MSCEYGTMGNILEQEITTENDLQQHTTLKHDSLHFTYTWINSKPSCCKIEVQRNIFCALDMFFFRPSLHWYLNIIASCYSEWVVAKHTLKQHSEKKLNQSI